ncbi:hypothetical protein HMPREF1137_1578 [Actinomyces sp. ICM39]|nr:hypothetical protein HMPREF1137_1578 [Actinomyces sp. ICM39]
MRRFRHASTLTHAGRRLRRRRISILAIRTQTRGATRTAFLARHADTYLTCTDSYVLHIDVIHAISL